jgi:hypothetical protein
MNAGSIQDLVISSGVRQKRIGELKKEGKRI